MSTKHYRTGSEYIGGFGDGAKPPKGAIECPKPNHAYDTWDGSAWQSKPDDSADYPLNPFQFFTFLEKIGLSESTVDSAIDAVEPDVNKRIEHKCRFRHAATYDRDHPLLILLVSAVGKTPAEIDDAWILAGKSR